MGDVGLTLLTGWAVPNPCVYVISVVLGALYVRVVLAILWTIDEKASKQWLKETSWVIFCRRFWGQRSDDQQSDHWHPFVLGLLELFVAPVFIFTGAWVPIGGWLTLKTVAQWDAWKTSRHMFNRFLIGNALLLIWAYWMARWLVKVLPN